LRTENCSQCSRVLGTRVDLPVFMKAVLKRRSQEGQSAESGKCKGGKRRAGPQSASDQGWLMAVLHLLLVFVSEIGQESLCGLSQLSRDRSLLSRWPSEKWLLLLKIPLLLLFSACCHDFGVSSFDICSSSNYSF